VSIVLQPQEASTEGWYHPALINKLHQNRT